MKQKHFYYKKNNVLLIPIHKRRAQMYVQLNLQTGILHFKRRQAAGLITVLSGEAGALRTIVQLTCKSNKETYSIPTIQNETQIGLKLKALLRFMNLNDKHSKAVLWHTGDVAKLLKKYDDEVKLYAQAN